MSLTSAYKVRINTHTADSTALVLLADGMLIGILTELSDECHGADQGRWAIEIAFGIDENPFPATFACANDAANWLSARVAGDRFNLDQEITELH